MGRRHKEDASIEEPVSNAVEGVEAESVEEEQEGPMIPFLFIGFPQGFLTGCDYVFISLFSDDWTLEDRSWYGRNVGTPHVDMRG